MTGNRGNPVSETENRQFGPKRLPVKKWSLLLAVAIFTAGLVFKPVLGETDGSASDDRHATRKVAVFISLQLFDETGFAAAHHSLTEAGWQPVIISTDTAIASGFDTGLAIRPDHSIRNIEPADYRGIILVGGSGAVLTWQNQQLFATVKRFAEMGKPVAAEGLAIPILARAGVLEGRGTAFYPIPSSIELVTDHGAQFRHGPVVVDDNLVTAAITEDPDRSISRSFLSAFISALETSPK